jgi:hypothetical protein
MDSKAPNPGQHGQQHPAASRQTESKTGGKSQESLRKEIEELETVPRPTAEQNTRLIAARAEYTTLVEEAAKTESAKTSHDADDKAPR